MKEDDVDEALRAYADRWRAAQAPPPDPTGRRAGTRPGRSALAVLGAAAAVVLVIGGAALLTPNQRQDRAAPATVPTSLRPGSGSPSTGSVIPTPLATPSPTAEAKRCRLDVRPTYLPWLEEGDPVPEPYIHDEPPPGSDIQVILDWHAPTSRNKDVYYVSLRAGIEGVGGPGEKVPAHLFGEAGSFYEGTVPGDAAIIWFSYGPCNTVTLELSAARRMTRAEARREIIRVAQSLR